MAGRKGKAQANEKRAEETIGPLPSYPYGAKSPKTPDSPTIPTTDPPTKRQQSSEAKETEGPGVVSDADPKEDTDTTHKPPSESTPDTSEGSQGDNAGDTLRASTAAVAADEAGPRAREGPFYATLIGRFTREGRWREIAPVRDAMVSEAKGKGMHINDAREWAYAELDRLYPPIPKAEPPPEPTISPVESPSQPSADAVPGLYSIPENWPPLPDNASLQQELGWVQSQRLAVVEERGNAVTVRLERASSPAPSKAALGWLETSIRSYAKYIEVAAKTLAGQADEAESTRRERMRLDEIRALLDEMHRDQV